MAGLPVIEAKSGTGELSSNFHLTCCIHFHTETWEKIMNPSPPSYGLNSNLDSLVLDGCCFKVSSEFKIMEITIGNFSSSFSKKSWKHTKKCQPRQIMSDMKVEIKWKCIIEFFPFHRPKHGCKQI